jgi:hypothetical protein
MGSNQIVTRTIEASTSDFDTFGEPVGVWR